MTRTYALTLPDGGRYLIELRASLGAPIFYLYGPKYSSSGGPIYSGRGILDLETMELLPDNAVGLPWAEISYALQRIMPRIERIRFEVECAA